MHREDQEKHNINKKLKKIQAKISEKKIDDNISFIYGNNELKTIVKSCYEYQQ